MRAFSWAVLSAALLAAPAWAQQSEDEAGDVSEVDKDSAGPLRDRIPPVSGYRFLQAGRFEVTPTFGVSVRDAFFTKLLFGGGFTYHFTNNWGLGGRLAYTHSLISGAAQICSIPQPDIGIAGGCRPPTFQELTTSGGAPRNVAYGLTAFVASVDLQWAPIYGKLSLSAEAFLGFNMYFLVGPAAVVYSPRGDFTVGGNVGFGFRFFINKFMTLRAELRDTIYYEIGFPSPARDSLRNQLTTEFGLSFFFPTTFTEL